MACRASRFSNARHPFSNSCADGNLVPRSITETQKAIWPFGQCVVRPLADENQKLAKFQPGLAPDEQSKGVWPPPCEPSRQQQRNSCCSQTEARPPLNRA